MKSGLHLNPLAREVILAIDDNDIAGVRLSEAVRKYEERWVTLCASNLGCR